MIFFDKVVKKIISSLSNNYTDNWDHVRFGKQKPIAATSFVRKSIQNKFRERGYYHIGTFEAVLRNSFQIHKFEFLYNQLVTAQDKDLLIQVLAYRVLGPTKVRLPLSNPAYWERIKELEKLCDKNDKIDPGFLHFSLEKVNLNPIGFPIEFYFTAAGIMTDFVVKQYEYNKNGVVIKADKGDNVIDGGGCWGDTALYFANEAGAQGKVFSFEFIPNNIEIFNKNISMNNNLRDSIELVNHPLWDNSSTKAFFKDFGPGSKVSMDRFADADGECMTKCIDDLVTEKKLDSLDFIKLDIEGAELKALEGAADSIKRFKPKIAVALYHNEEDFEAIPLYLKQLVPEYNFYFSHCTMYAEESILFAKAN